MGYILKKSTGGGGGGDATAANQNLQLNQLYPNSGENSVFKELNDQSVFLNNKGLPRIAMPNDGVNAIEIQQIGHSQLVNDLLIWINANPLKSILFYAEYFDSVNGKFIATVIFYDL